jgi:hypothetical protein
VKEKPTVGSPFLGGFPSDIFPKMTKGVSAHFCTHSSNFCKLYHQILLFVLFGYLCCSMYCLCVNVYCHRVTTQLQLINILYHVSYHIIIPGNVLKLLDICTCIYLCCWHCVYLVSRPRPLSNIQNRTRRFRKLSCFFPQMDRLRDIYSIWFVGKK